jgi:hypothetical protein
MESGRRGKAQAALTRINVQSGLSRDVSEIVSRTLGDE